MTDESTPPRLRVAGSIRVLPRAVMAASLPIEKCSFCGLAWDQVLLVAGDSGDAFICAECAAFAVEILRHRSSRADEEEPES